GRRPDRAGARGAARLGGARGAALVPARVARAEADRAARRAVRALLPALHRRRPAGRAGAHRRLARRARHLDPVGDPEGAGARRRAGRRARLRADRRADPSGSRGGGAARARRDRRARRRDRADPADPHRGGAVSADKPRYRAWFEALHDPSERYPLDEVVYTARDGGLLQVVHDLDQLRKTPAAAWKRLFEERAHRNEWPYGSGVWGKKEWVCPDIDNDNIVSMYEGHSNLFWAERYGQEIGL